MSAGRAGDSAGGGLVRAIWSARTLAHHSFFSSGVDSVLAGVNDGPSSSVSLTRPSAAGG